MTTRDIKEHLRELYGTDVSPELISRATEGVMDEFRAWRSRPLEPVYPTVYLDALFVSVRDGGQVAKRAFFVALGVRVDWTRDVLGLWASANEGSKFWLSILTEPKNRGVQDVLFICADGLTGLPQAIEAAFPKAVHQTCVVHLLRSALRFVSWKDRKRVSKALRTVYTADSEQAAERALDEAAKQSVPDQNLHSVMPLAHECEQVAAEWIEPPALHELEQPIVPASYVDRLRREIHRHRRG